jgi:large conductance mechanosensitive channel
MYDVEPEVCGASGPSCAFNEATWAVATLPPLPTQGPYFNEENDMIKGFRDFIMRGNVIDLAVAVIIGAAFTAIVTSFVTNILSPLIASLGGKPDFSALVLYLNGGKINYGTFLNSVISFLMQAAVVYFVIVLPMNYIMKQLKGKPPVPDPTEKTCGQCKSLVPITATRCKFCTQPI